MKVRKDSVDIGFIVRHEDEMKRFYGEGLGLERVFSESPPPDILPPARTVHHYRIGDTALKLWHIHDSTPPDGPDERLGQVGLRYLTVLVDDLQDTYDRLIAQGFPQEDKPHRSVVGAAMTLCFVRDPDGNYIELIQSDDPSGKIPRNFRGVATEFKDK